MFSELAKLLKEANCSRINLGIAQAENQEIRVVITTTQDNKKANDPELANALALPLSVQGSVAELDSQLGDIILRHAESLSARATNAKLPCSQSGEENKDSESAQSDQIEPDTVSQPMSATDDNEITSL